ncbi:unnamed protein product [Rotaria sp. Silwood2]|nr:unnamed protein product [Rotaria sp. Silwood2]CAF4422705.1 unnamed protein product [Rotaria sp. Silwood2]
MVVEIKQRITKENKQQQDRLLIGAVEPNVIIEIDPNHVSKRELGNTLRLELFNSIKSIISIDMNEYTESNSNIRFIDKLSNYVSFEQDSQLIETVQEQFNDIILFDEIEKEHLQIWNILLKILNNSYFIVNQIISFQNTIIIFTSNIGEQFILEENQSLLSTTENLNGKLSQTIKDHIMKEVCYFFK